MTFALVSCLVLGPLAILAIDLLRGHDEPARETKATGPVSLDGDGHRIRAPRPKWPAPTEAGTTDANSSRPGRSGRFRPTGGRRDYFGDGLLDRSA